MPLQSYQAKRRKVNGSTPRSVSSSSASTTKAGAPPTTPSKTSKTPSSPSHASASSTTKASNSNTATNSKKRRASVVYVDVSDNDEDAKLPVYTVEEIINHRKAKDGHYQYLIKWEGYSHNQNTWEYDRNVLDKSLVEAYWDSYADNRIRKAEEELAVVKRQLEEATRRDDMDVDQGDSMAPLSPANSRKALPQAVRSKHPASPDPMRKLPSMVPNASPDRRPARVRRLVTRREREMRGSSVDIMDDGVESVDDDSDQEDIVLCGVRPPSRSSAIASPPRIPPPVSDRRHVATSPISPSSSLSGTPSKGRSQQALPSIVAERIANMDQEEIFAFLESRDKPKPETRFSPQVLQMLAKLSEHELVDLLATRGIHPPDDSSYIRPSPSQSALLMSNKRAAATADPLDPTTQHGDERDTADEDEDQEDEDIDEDHDDSDASDDNGDQVKPHPLAHMYRGLAKRLAEVPQEDILQWIYDRKYAASIDQVLGFDDTSPETQAALAEVSDVASAANPLVYVLYKDGTEARVSLDNLICRAPKVASDFLLNMRVQILEDEMSQLAASQGPAGNSASASQRVSFVQGMFGSQYLSQRRTLSLPSVEEGHDSSDETGDADASEAEGQGSQEAPVPVDASDMDLTAQGSSPTVPFRFARDTSQQPMDSPTKPSLAIAMRQSPTRPRPLLDTAGTSISNRDSDLGADPEPSQTLARSSVSPHPKSPLSPLRATGVEEQGVAPRVGLLTSIVQTLTPKRWSLGQEDM